ncbi:mitogen-activated protein kinase kinase kinase 17-like [Durio zibethinus]|uniref:Mitogen-activated protein kinase kinase kinase 17-like n=1 Tax=Durio zibethinus TaxID=66656 RepID=A0A6P6A4K2_DURZI|nr:mitogen-activated protein kinase kinase kinase 17-like [Durio zibethinus]
MIKKYGGMIPEGDAKCYARMLLERVWDIHQRGFVQKPKNIIVFPSYQNGSISRLKIADFGLVRRPRERYHMPDPWMPTFPGTAVYMSLESFIYGHISTTLDISSIGCIVLEMITGKLPWEYQDLTDLGIKIGFSIYSPKIPETMSSTGKDFLMKCFQWDLGKMWTVDMLLSHPFLLPDPSPIKSL